MTLWLVLAFDTAKVNLAPALKPVNTSWQAADNKWQATESAEFRHPLICPRMKKPNCPTTIIAAGLALLAATKPARADEQFFGYTYTSDVLPKGGWELEQWLTERTGKETGTFSATDFRTELEHGFTDHLQGSLYLNYNYYYMHDAVSSSGPLDNRNRFGLNGVSSEWVYQLRSPYKDGYGFSVYLEPGFNTLEEADGSRIQEVELESKLIVEKHWLDDMLIGAFNYTLEPEWAKADGEHSFSTNLKMEGSTGLA